MKYFYVLHIFLLYFLTDLNNKKTTFEVDSFYLNKIAIIISFGTDGGTRTHMVSRQILSLVRLPVPPHRHMTYLYYQKMN